MQFKFPKIPKMSRSQSGNSTDEFKLLNDPDFASDIKDKLGTSITNILNGASSGMTISDLIKQVEIDMRADSIPEICINIFLQYAEQHKDDFVKKIEPATTDLDDQNERNTDHADIIMGEIIANAQSIETKRKMAKYVINGILALAAVSILASGAMKMNDKNEANEELAQVQKNTSEKAAIVMRAGIEEKYSKAKEYLDALDSKKKYRKYSKSLSQILAKAGKLKQARGMRDEVVNILAGIREALDTNAQLDISDLTILSLKLDGEMKKWIHLIKTAIAGHKEIITKTKIITVIDSTSTLGGHKSKNDGLGQGIF